MEKCAETSVNVEKESMKRLMRAKRFSLATSTTEQEEKRKARALRFGSTSLTEEDKRKRRAERFGTPANEKEKRQTRAIRFGLNRDSTVKNTKDDSWEAKIAARQLRFGVKP